jgi:hypothetical protein
MLYRNVIYTNIIQYRLSASGLTVAAPVNCLMQRQKERHNLRRLHKIMLSLSPVSAPKCNAKLLLKFN